MKSSDIYSFISRHTSSSQELDTLREGVESGVTTVASFISEIYWFYQADSYSTILY